MDETESTQEISDEEWRRRLTPEQYGVLRQKATEAPFSGVYTHPMHTGRFLCAGCGADLFESDTQFDSGSGWPSFTQPVEAEAIVEVHDRSHGMGRTEVVCARCGGHLGHVFDDGPAPTGLRYCINSTAIELKGGESAT